MTTDSAEVAVGPGGRQPSPTRKRARLAGARNVPQGSTLGLHDPEPWPDPVDGADLANDILALLQRFLSLPEGSPAAIVLWVLHAHSHGASNVSPLLVLYSPEMRCGKTTTLSLLSALVPRPLLASNITSAALFRIIEVSRPTLLVDEADSFLGEREELRGILNSGHLRSAARVVRSVGEDHEPRAFSTWAPKALALIGRVQGTLEDRAVLVRMRRRAPSERVEPMRIDRLDCFEPLRQRAWRWAQDHLEQLRESDPSVPSELNDRAADNWRPLLAIADQLGGEWPERARLSARLLSGSAAPADDTPGVLLLADLRELFRDRGADRVASAAILAALIGREDRPWAEFKNGRPLTLVQLARVLKKFDIAPRTARIGTATPRAYFEEDCRDAFERYLPPTAQQPQQKALRPGFVSSGKQNTTLDVAGGGSEFGPPVEPLVAGVVGRVAEPGAATRGSEVEHAD